MELLGYVPKKKLEAAEEEARAESRRANEERKAAVKAREEAEREAERKLEALNIADKEREIAETEHRRAEEERKAATEARGKAEREKVGKLEALKIADKQRERAETAEQEQQLLQSEKDEKKRRDEKLMQFSWGPKNKAGGQWTTQVFEKLQTKFFKHLKDPEGKLIRAKILIFGPTGSGKSSFCNGLRSALKDADTPATYYAVGSIGTTLTGSFQATRYGDHWIIDMPGIFESSDFKTENIEAIASGKVRFDAKITKTLEVEGGQSQQEARRDVSCVVLVLHHNIDLGEELKRQLDVILKLGGDGALSYHLVLTHLDECDPQFKDPDNIPNLYSSPQVQEAVKNMSEQTGIPPYSISYVKNHVTETETDTKTKLLHLKALDRILTSAAEQVEKMIDKKLQKKMYEDAPDTEEKKMYEDAPDTEETQAVSEEKKLTSTDWTIPMSIFAVGIIFVAVVYMFIQ